MLRRTAILAGIILLCACSVGAQDHAKAPGRDGAAAAQQGQQGAQGQQAQQAQQGRRGGRSGDTTRSSGGGRAAAGDTAGGARGGRAGRNASIVLGAADVAKVTKGTVEATIAVSGDLRALESATIRSRLDGILEKVYVREGQAVTIGAVLAKYESSEQEASLRSADADVAATRSDAETAAWNAEQSRELFKVGAIAERDLRLAEQAADAAKARLAASEARQRAAANVVRDTRVLAPFAGTIEKRLVQDGENTPRGTQLFTMVRAATLELMGSVPAKNSDDVKPGQTVRLTADGRAFTGRVSRVSPTIDPSSRSVAVYLTVPNPRGLLKGNTFATGQIVTATVGDALTVPSSALRVNADGTRLFVYKIQGDALEMTYVKTGITDEAHGTVQIVDGLREQEQVVVGSPGTLGPGMKVQIIGNEGRGGRRGRGAAP
ncbi:MAG: efflux RND transporter periplasmic adaptor subunit [Gemmatimonadota bacterium]|nr:efflux RND transporter periplasmic adaptor subunit [Gemmatimonadota bacterium]